MAQDEAVSVGVDDGDSPLVPVRVTCCHLLATRTNEFIDGLLIDGVSSPMGAVAEELRLTPGAVRSRHPQASVAALGACAGDIVASHPLHFAVGRGSPFERLRQLDGWILLVGVGHNRNSFLHHAESLIDRPRLKQRRFPVLVEGERIWWETLDVGDDNNTHFPVVGEDYERQAGTRPVQVGRARTVLLPAQDFVTFASRRLAELIDHERAAASS